MAVEQERRKLSIWNVFQRIETEDEARDAAKGGVAVAILIALGYVLMLGAKLLGSDPYGDGDTTAVVTVDVIAIALAALLAWRVNRRQPIWACILLFVWVIAETISKIALIGSNSSFHPSAASFFVNAIGIAAGTMSVRGSLKLAAFRREAKRAAAATQPHGDIRTRLQTLDQLKNNGLISDEEYQQKRSTLLNEI